MEKTKLKLTKEQIYGVKSFLAFVLRHKPYFYKIKLDNEGYANIDFVVKAVNKAKKLELTNEDVVEIGKKFSGGIFKVDEKKGKIRAKNGHSVVFNMSLPEGFKEAKTIPNRLYFRVSKKDIAGIMESKGITLANEQIMLCPDNLESTNEESVITIHAQKAKADSVKFYYLENEDIYFTRHLPSQYISFHV